MGRATNLGLESNRYKLTNKYLKHKFERKSRFNTQNQDSSLSLSLSLLIHPQDKTFHEQTWELDANKDFLPENV